jgi:trk system potassium uptake protein TrkH
MKRHQASDTYYLLAFFAVLITIGTFALWLPWSWRPEAGRPLSFIDALFTATSAVCVTGLVPVDSAYFSRFGLVVIMLLIQFGGLGIIAFTSLLLAFPGGRLPLRRIATIRGFYLSGVEHEPAVIVRSIIMFTLGVEAVGAIVLSLAFRAAGQADWAFMGLFHAVSAFCNAGFSTSAASLEPYADRATVLLPAAALIVLGGLGFIVLQDIERRLRGKRRRLSFHTKVVLGGTAFLIAVGAVAFFLLERNSAFAGLSTGDAWINAVFQSITPRTAGFDAVAQPAFGQTSKVLTILLMFIGGSPGSIAGGIKVTTAFVVFAVMLRRPDARGDIAVFRRRLGPAQTNAAVVYFLKAGSILFLAAGLLSLTEGGHGADFGAIVFEAVSAFGTVGLSLNFTPRLSFLGKLVIIATMFAGRVGLVALAFPSLRRAKAEIAYPQGNVLLG